VYGAIVLGMDTSNVAVCIGGKLRKSKGKLVGVDLNRVSRLVHQSRDHIVSKAGWPRTRLGGTYRVIETYGNRPDGAVGGGSNAVAGLTPGTHLSPGVLGMDDRHWRRRSKEPYVHQTLRATCPIKRNLASCAAGVVLVPASPAAKPH
jgi:hypothetical protein